MSQQRNQSDREKCCCPICLDLLKDPVTTPCGHDYCMRCIKIHFDGEDQRGIYSCPLCRETFIPRPQLVKNTMLAEVVEELKMTGLQAAPADPCYARPEDVACDVCTGRKLKAVKSCWQCLVSYCEKHLQSHESAAFKDHKLVAPLKRLKESICSDHNEVMKMFCHTDQQCICSLCSTDKHKGHETVSAEEERTEKQKELDVSLQEIQKRIQTREKEVKVLQQEEEAIKQAADKTVEDCDKIMNELIHLIKEGSLELKQQIRSEQRTEVTRVKEFKMKWKQEITELRRNEAELKDLCRTEDNTEFLLSYPLKSKVSDNLPPDSSNINVRPLSYFEDMKAALTKTREEIQQNILGEWRKTSLMVKSVDVLLPKAEPKTRDEFLKYSYQMTLDPTTVHNQLFLCDKDRNVSDGSAPSSHLQKQERFIQKKQALSRDSLTGRCYWEVEMSGKGVSVAVAYKNIPEMDKTGFGNNSHSWTLDCFKQSYEFRHDRVKTRISGPLSSRVGVYVDTRAGTLSFYSVSDTMTLLHRVQTTFTEPLYGGLWIWSSFWGGSTAKFIELE